MYSLSEGVSEHCRINSRNSENPYHPHFWIVLDENITIELALKIHIDWCNKNSKRVEFECIGRHIHFTAGSAKLHSSSWNTMHIKHSSLSNICAIIYIKNFSKNASQKQSKMARVQPSWKGLWPRDQERGDAPFIFCYFAIWIQSRIAGAIHWVAQRALSTIFMFEAFPPRHGHYIYYSTPALRLPYIFHIFYAYWYKYPVVI